jgi:hypothetical protein
MGRMEPFGEATEADYLSRTSEAFKVRCPVQRVAKKIIAEQNL